MLLCRRPLLFATDALGVAGVAAVIAAVAMGVVLPVRRAAQARPMLCDDIAQAQSGYEVVTSRNRVLADTIRTLESAMEELSVARHSDTGEFLAFVSTACAEEGFRLQQVTPQGVETQADHRSWDAQMRASGPFATFPRLLARIEAWSPFVHVRDLDVAGPPEGGPAECQFVWTVRVNYLRGRQEPAEAPKP